MNELISKKRNAPIHVQQEFTVKAGVFFHKNAKIASLEEQNQRLRCQLAEEIKKNKQLNESTQQNRQKLQQIQNSKNFHQIEELMMQQSIVKLENEINKLNEDVVEKERKVGQLSHQVDGLREQHQSLLLSDQQAKNLIQRYREQIKVQKLMLRSQKNATNVCSTLKNNLQNYQKNISILENKLQSRKKYLTILQKKKVKLQKEQKLKIQVKQQKKHLLNTNHRSTKGFYSQKILNQEPKNHEECSKNNKQQMKNFNQLIRKKNTILSQKSK